MDRIETAQAFFWKYQGKILSTQAMNAVAGEFLSTLIDKEAFLIGWFGLRTVLIDIESNELDGFSRQLYLPEAISLAQNGESFAGCFKVIQIQAGNFTCSMPESLSKCRMV